MIRAAVIGATGYTGLELIRLSENHPYLEISVITSREKAGKSLKGAFAWSGKYADLVFEKPVVEKIAGKVQVAFLCVPSGKAQEMAYSFLQRGIKVIDLSADFRFKNPKSYENTYNTKHNYPELCEKAVYGLTEIFGEEIRKAELVANPGCYPTSALLPLIPLIKNGLIEKEPIIIDSKSGTSGAGRKAESYYSFCEVNEDFKAYKIASHRHNPEIEEKLNLFSDEQIQTIFTPHLLPINRGILSTIYVKFKTEVEKIYKVLRKFYKESSFVEIVPMGEIPRIAEVKGTNLCKIGIFEDKKRGWGIIVSVIDNLIKGASGQAIQNFNLMFGFPEDTGLPKTSLFV
ncbi:MAG: N-acetyl-gamma-glutamylphosphate reductase [Thermodesulfobacterium sp.]|uniref:N-acetyl-gamma-glutamyl-phosphate reductase n=1 Tax=Candidatus Thermodesulfobacterium syntrophicum TaxID=3060442 RepID=A0AAE3P4D0_9BACT|nr:N-acetyl-gamma-glutamylphosphate reductase [Candidatus Thermodesulfobacterium syntrophicum]